MQFNHNDDLYTTILAFCTALPSPVQPQSITDVGNPAVLELETIVSELNIS
jgi:hypothetical protein